MRKNMWKLAMGLTAAASLMLGCAGSASAEESAEKANIVWAGW